MPVIDADCHVIEADHTWAYLDPADEALRPQPYQSPDEPSEAFWVIDGSPRRRPFGGVAQGLKSEDQSGFARTTMATRTLGDIKARLAHMDELGVDVQVLYPTIYLTQISQKPTVDLALAKSYNRWMADTWAQSAGRLRWVAVPPLLTMEAVPEQLRFAKENGAVGVFMRGFEGNRQAADPYFFPMYEVAQELDLAITFHAGCGNPAFVDLTDGDAYTRNKVPVISAFHSLLFRDIPSKFPNLRFGFVEVAANWVPYILTDLERRVERQGRVLTKNVLADNNMFVACQTNDDFAHIMNAVGDDNLMIGSDYGHNDTSSELEALRLLKESGGLSEPTLAKILDANPTRLYAM
jgi:predicted TIM-barrel fold metal-dependent hydrolase